MGKTRLWCFTNFDLDFDYQKVIDTTTAQYILIGTELCPKTQKKHHQGFIYFSGARGSYKQVGKQLGNSHVEMCKGNIDQNTDYCSKDENVKEYGIRPALGCRTDLDAIKDDLLNSKISVDEICVEMPTMYHQYGRTLNKLEDIALRRKHRSWMTEGEWVYGATGTGKSHYAFTDFNSDSHYIYPNDGGWWDGYKGQGIVIVNEFRGGIAYSELLDLLDKYPKQVRRRGREPVPFLAKKIIITSSLPPCEVYSNLAISDSLKQLYRRVKLIKMEQKWSEGNTGTSDPLLEGVPPSTSI